MANERMCERVEHTITLSLIPGTCVLMVSAQDVNGDEIEELVFDDLTPDKRKEESTSMSIEDIENTAIVGNAHHDSGLLNACHVFIVDDSNDMIDRIRAIKKIDQTMGFGSKSTPTESDVLNYVKECS